MDKITISDKRIVTTITKDDGWKIIETLSRRTIEDEWKRHFVRLSPEEFKILFEESKQ